MDSRTTGSGKMDDGARMTSFSVRSRGPRRPPAGVGTAPPRAEGAAGTRAGAWATVALAIAFALFTLEELEPSPLPLPPPLPLPLAARVVSVLLLLPLPLPLPPRLLLEEATGGCAVEDEGNPAPLLLDGADILLLFCLPRQTMLQTGAGAGLGSGEEGAAFFGEKEKLGANVGESKRRAGGTYVGDRSLWPKEEKKEKKRG